MFELLGVIIIGFFCLVMPYHQKMIYFKSFFRMPLSGAYNNGWMANTHSELYLLHVNFKIKKKKISKLICSRYFINTCLHVTKVLYNISFGCKELCFPSTYYMFIYSHSIAFVYTKRKSNISPPYNVGIWCLWKCFFLQLLKFFSDKMKSKRRIIFAYNFFLFFSL